MPISNHQRIRIAVIACVKEGMECLQELIALHSNIVGIVTFTDKMAGKMSGAVSFDEIATENGIPLYKIVGTNSPEALAIIKELQPDVIFVIGWTRLVSADILSIPQYGCIGMHASLLPKYRGRAPVNWALINNEVITGNSTILLDEGVDTGKVISQKKIKISLADTCDTLYSKVAQAGRAMIRDILPLIGTQAFKPIVQNEDEATEMPKRTPGDGIIDWRKSALALFNWVRALTHPYPGAFTFWECRKLFIWEARIAHFSPTIPHDAQLKTARPGTIISTTDGIAIVTGGNDLLTIHRLNLEGQDETGWQEFLLSNELKVGDAFDLHVPDLSVDV